MLVLVPPSQSKAAPPRRGRPVDLAALSFPGLSQIRARVLAALIALGGRPDAAALLGLGPALAAEAARNARLDVLPAVRVSDLYTGVLFEALDWATLDAAARRRAGSRLVVVSALWGALRPGDRVPPYRLAMDVDLPGVGPLAALWRPVLGPQLAAAAGGRGVLVDCRSATYQAAWTPPPALARRTASIRVVREVDGIRSVVSHLAKHTRGQVARELLATGQDPRTVPALAELLARRWPVEVFEPARPGRAWTLAIVLRD